VGTEGRSEVSMSVMRECSYETRCGSSCDKLGRRQPTWSRHPRHKIAAPKRPVGSVLSPPKELPQQRARTGRRHSERLGRHEVTITNFTGAVKGGDLLLAGRCSECQGDVARLIESS
jgi:hypothetical protein